MSDRNLPHSRPNLGDWIYSRLLHVYPHAFRSEYGDAMCQAFRRLRQETLRQRGVPALLTLWMKAFCDVLRTGVVERRRHRQPQEIHRVTWGILHDLRYGFRTLRNNSGYAAGAIVTLALGIGATTTVFSQVNGLLIRPLPYGNPERLVQLSETSPDITAMDLSYPDFCYWQQHTEVFESMAAFDDARFAMAVGNQSERIEGAVVSTSVFATLGVAPILGRAFLPEDGNPEAELVVIVSHSLWADRLASDTSAVGQSLVLNGRSFTIVGVAPPNFMFPERARLWVPITLDPLRANPNEYEWDAVALRKVGFSIEQAALEASEIARQLARANPETKANLGAIVYPLRDADIGSETRLAYLVLMCSVAFVLLIACVNVANLMLARGASRRREISLRRALGASRARIVSLVITESCLLALLGGIIGLFIAVWANKLILISLPGEIPFWINFDVDIVVLGFVFLISVSSTLVVGILPALETSDRSLSSVTHSGLLGRTFGSLRRRSSSLLLASEVALSFVLLIAGTMMMKGFLNLRATSPGLNPENVLAIGIYTPEWKYPLDERATLLGSILQEIGAIPGARSVAAVAELPIAGGENEVVFAVEEDAIDLTNLPVANGNVVSPGYFTTMQIPHIRGRDFNEGDRGGDLPVVIVSQSLADRYWPDEDPVGKRIRLGEMWHRTPSLPETVAWHTVVGVVGDVRHEELAVQGRMGIYVPLAQQNTSALTMVMRTVGDPLALVEATRSRIWRVGPGVVIIGVASMNQILADSIWSARVFTGMLGCFAMVALTLAAVGIYSVVTFAVASRTSEIGVRMALGAKQFDVIRLMLAQTTRILATGLILGLVGALAVARVLTSLVHEVSAFDPGVFAGVATVLLTVGVVAGFVPARRAARLDPTVTLREE